MTGVPEGRKDHIWRSDTTGLGRPDLLLSWENLNMNLRRQTTTKPGLPVLLESGWPHVNRAPAVFRPLLCACITRDKPGWWPGQQVPWQEAQSTEVPWVAFCFPRTRVLTHPHLVLGF